MGIRKILEKLFLGDSAKKNTEKINNLIDHVNDNVTPYIVAPDNVTIHKIPKGDDDEQLASNVEFVTSAQYVTLTNGQPVILADGRRIVFDENCVYFVTDDNGDPVQNLVYKRSNASLIRKWAEELICNSSDTLEDVPTLAYLYAHKPLDGPATGSLDFSCVITKLGDEFIEIQATDMASGHVFVTIKKDGKWTDWNPSAFNNEIAHAPVSLFVSQMEGSDITGAGTPSSPYETVEEALKHVPNMMGNHKLTIYIAGGRYTGFTARRTDVVFKYWGSAVTTTAFGQTTDSGKYIVFTTPITLMDGCGVMFDTEQLPDKLFFEDPLIVVGRSFVDVPCDMEMYLTDKYNIGLAVNTGSNFFCGGLLSISEARDAAISTAFKGHISCKELKITNSPVAVRAAFASEIVCGEFTRSPGSVMQIDIGCVTKMGKTTTNQVYDRRTIAVNTMEGTNSYLIGTLDAENIVDYRTTFRVSTGGGNNLKYGYLTISLRLNDTKNGVEYIKSTWDWKSPGLDTNKVFYVYRVEEGVFRVWLYVNMDKNDKSYLFEIVSDSQTNRATPGVDRWEMIGYSSTGTKVELIPGEAIYSPVLGEISTGKVVAEEVDIKNGGSIGGTLQITNINVTQDMVVNNFSVEGEINMGDTMKGSTFDSDLVTESWIAGNRGKVLINSTADHGKYVALSRLASTGGYFTLGVYQDKYILSYTSNADVIAGRDVTTKQMTLMDEDGNAAFPGSINVSGTVSATDITATNAVNGKNVSATETISGKNVTASNNVSATNAVSGKNVTATETVSGKDITASNNVSATNAVSGKNVTATETISGKNVTASNNISATNDVSAKTLTISVSATAAAPSTGRYLRNIGSGTAEPSTSNCPLGCIYGKYS